MPLPHKCQIVPVQLMECWSHEARIELVSYLTDTVGTPVLMGKPIQGERPVEGRLTGGNLTLLASLVGTGYLPSWRGAIVLFEAINKAPETLDRELLQLHQAGAFDDVVGVVLGQFTDCTADDDDGIGVDRVIRFLVAHVDIPILAGLPIGHGRDSRAVVFGTNARLDPVDGTLTVNLR